MYWANANSSFIGPIHGHCAPRIVTCAAGHASAGRQVGSKEDGPGRATVHAPLCVQVLRVALAPEPFAMDTFQTEEWLQCLRCCPMLRELSLYRCCDVLWCVQGL